MKLKYSVSSDGKKVYTLKDKVNGKQTLEAHYKFIKLSDAKGDFIPSKSG